MITQNDIDKIDIVALLDDYDLNPRVTSTNNANFCCPFHGERNPSCGMKVTTGLWKCFACGMSGNLTSFVAEMDGISLADAETKIKLKWVEKVPDVNSLVDTIQNILARSETIHSAEIIYPKWLLSRYTKEVSYMLSRGLERRTCEAFDVVYDPITKYQGFPCYNLKGQLVGITGRNTENKEPRYFPLLRFKKSHYIYNLWRIDKDQPVIAVEGEINAMAVWQAGYTNVIAFLGAGVSSYQIELMRNSGIKELIIFFDSDQAGHHGTVTLFQDLWLYMKLKGIVEHDGDAATMTKDQIKLLVETAEEFTVEM